MTNSNNKSRKAQGDAVGRRDSLAKAVLRAQPWRLVPCPRPRLCTRHRHRVQVRRHHKLKAVASLARLRSPASASVFKT